ncbi:putative glycosyltransferase [Mycobacteroides abscessus subsp. abscessus]|nr:putative glycosyltransferase [Mycobacteroides abscessus subsp. abscessus]
MNDGGQKLRHIERAALRPPALVLDIDTDGNYGDKSLDVAKYKTAWCLVRRSGVAVAVQFLNIEEESTLSLEAVRRLIAETDLPSPITIENGCTASLTVVICTRDRSDELTRALTSLTQQSDTNFKVLIVDNSARGDVVKSQPHVDGLDIRYCHEPIPGLAHARNRALTELDSELVAWLDDDEVADADWVAWIKRGFASASRPDAVVGKMFPAELIGNAPVDWERYGGHNKGRGMQPELLRAGTPTVIDPLYPRPIFGSGGNMAFQVKKLREIGGFDNRLGAGTLTRGGEDTKALSLLLESGGSILHWPPAIAWHYHRATDDELETKLFGNAAGLTAYYMSMFMTSPKYIWRIVTLLPRGLKDTRSHTVEVKQESLPKHLTRATQRGLINGPLLYVREALKQRRYRKQQASSAIIGRR